MFSPFHDVITEFDCTLFCEVSFFYKFYEVLFSFQQTVMPETCMEKRTGLHIQGPLFFLYLKWNCNISIEFRETPEDQALGKYVQLLFVICLKSFFTELLNIS
jgi:hypothetical protein